MTDHDDTRSRPALTALSARPGAGLRLYCLPPAGAGASFYAPWVPHLPPDIELYGIQLPGRGVLTGQPLLTHPGEVFHALADVIHATDDTRPFAVFGHSTGALLAYETTRRLRRARCRLPALLAVSALPAPHRGVWHRQVVQGLAGEQTAFLDLLGPLPSRALANARHTGLLARAAVPLLADVLVSLQYRYLEEPPLDVPLAAYGGREDPLAAPEHLVWDDLTTRPLPVRLFPGGHTYALEQAPALTARLCADLRDAIRGQEPA
ncbi:thioesterase domain-containing protein [Streptomyces cinnamoneus]|uniref:thioesterase II family protein n=1 Tax=Streptomyces cinnamoneus TaxID=53446 RepID=UPI003413E2EC